MRLKAYAKINLTLDVTGKREDGYHTLDSVMQSISLCDELTLERGGGPGIRLRTDREYLPVNEKNTAYLAAKLFLEHLGLGREGLEIGLEKRVPSRAGLGGGSGDAAAVLLGLNRMFEAGLSTEELMALGARVGADVPFCVHGGTCRCRGIGEQVEPVSPLPDCFLVLCKPPVGMSTPRAYALLDRGPAGGAAATPAMLEALASGELRRVAGCLSNRFDAAMGLMAVKQAKRAMLRAGALGAMMSGSGSAVYGIFEAEAAARACLARLEGQGECFLCRPLQFYP